MELKTPVMHALIYGRIHKLGFFIRYKDLFSTIERGFCMSDETWGGNRKGIPRKYIPHIIKELERFKLIRKLERYNYRILKNPCYEQLLKLN